MRRVAILLVPLLVGLAASACGGSETTAPTTVSHPQVDVAQAAARTGAAASARFTLSGTTGRDGPFTGEGELAGERARLALHFSEPGGLLPADVEVVYADRSVFVRLSGLAGLLPGLVSGGAEWVGIDLAAYGDLLDEYLDLGKGDPGRLLETLEAAGAFEPVGAERVRGVETVRYRGSVASNQVDVWIGADELVRRVIVRDDDGGHAELELFDFGADVDIEPPPAEEVTPLADLLQGAF